MVRRNLWWWWLIGASALSVFWAWGLHIDGFLKGTYVSDQILLNIPTESLSIAAIFVGARMHLKTGRERAPWYFIMGGLVLFYMGGILDTNYEAWFNADSIPFPGLPDVFFVSGYVFIATGLFLLASRYRRGQRPLLIDGMVMGVVVAVLAWILAPRDVPQAPFYVIYPALDVMLLGLVIHQITAARRVWNTARALLLVAFFLLAMGDVFSGFFVLSGGEIPFGLGDQWYSFFFLSLAAAALHPDMVALGDRTREVDKPSRSFMPGSSLVVAAMVIAPILMYAGALRTWVPWVYGMVVVEMLVFSKSAIRPEH